MKKYDALYIFVGIAKEDVLEANLEKALAEVTRVGGNVLEKVSLGRRSFSRPMGKRDSGVYVKVRMELDPAKVDELVNRYHLVEEVFRVSAFRFSPSTSAARPRSPPSVLRAPSARRRRMPRPRQPPPLKRKRNKAGELRWPPSTRLF